MAKTKVKESVGILFMFEHAFGMRAVLMRRGKYDHKSAMGPQSWPGLCQVTVHGGIQNRESFGNTRLRESQEELGSYVEKVVGDAEKKEGALIKLSSMSSSERKNKTFGMLIDSYTFTKMQMDASSGGIELIGEEDVKNIKSSEEFDKETGVTDLNTIAMFPDEIEAVKQAFIKF